MEIISLVIVLLIIVGGIVLLKTFLRGVGEEKPLPYRTKKYFFSKSEQEFLRVLNDSIDRQRFVIFPKVRLADFIEVTVRGKEYQGWWNKIKSKHVDFLIWDVLQNKIALAIELDGGSHQSKKMIERDAFVNKLYERVEINLVRVAVGTSFTEEVEKIKISLQ